ncbi:chloride channel, partial [Gaertneriomyces semiglobifer]
SGRRVVYSDFTTIDWIHDLSKERVRVRNLKKLRGLRGRLQQAYDACQAWILVFIIGAVTGILAAYIDVASEWASDIKDGYCTAGFYLNRKFCCQGVDGAEKCDVWRDWNQAFGVTGLVGFWAEYAMYVAFGVTFAVMSAGLVKYYAPYAAGSGIPEVKTILGGFVIRKFLGGWTLIVKCIGLSLSVGSGLSLGKEGPLVHVACCVGNILARLFDKYGKNEGKRREILSASSAAGVSVAFGAPIGGVLFSLEEVSYYFPYKTMWRSFFCAMVAAIALQLMNPFRTGKLVLFAVEYKRAWHGFELPMFVLLGILGGLYGAFFIRMNIKVAEFRRTSWLRRYQVWEVTAVAALTCLIAFGVPFMRVSTVELVANLFRECVETEEDFYGLCRWEPLAGIIKYLLLACAIKIVLTVFTFGIRVPAGIFIPSMAVGATIGRALGIMMQLWQNAYPHSFLFASCKPQEECVTPGTYAMVGAAAALGGVTRMTVSLTVIMFELTGALTYTVLTRCVPYVVLPIMLTIMTSKWTADFLCPESIYDALIHLNGYPYLDPHTSYDKPTSNDALTANDVMTKSGDLEVLWEGMEVGDLELALEIVGERGRGFKGYPVVESREEWRLSGWVGGAEVRYALEQAKAEFSQLAATTPVTFTSETSSPLSAVSMNLSPGEPPYLDLRPWTDQTPITISPLWPLELVLELFKKMGLRYVLVVEGGTVRGVITKKDLLRRGVAGTRYKELGGDWMAG